MRYLNITFHTYIFPLNFIGVKVVKAIVRESDVDGDGFIAVHDFLTLLDKHANNGILLDSAAYVMIKSIEQFLSTDLLKSISKGVPHVKIH